MSDLFLIAHVAGRTVAIESSQVESVVDLGPVVPVPGSGAHVRGLAALRSRVVTVIDTHAALGLDVTCDAANRAVITIIDSHHYAILVDALDDVAPFELLPLSGGLVLDSHWAAAGCGLVERDGAAILAITLRALVPGAAALAA